METKNKNDIFLIVLVTIILIIAVIIVVSCICTRRERFSNICSKDQKNVVIGKGPSVCIPSSNYKCSSDCGENSSCKSGPSPCNDSTPQCNTAANVHMNSNCICEPPDPSDTSDTSDNCKNIDPHMKCIIHGPVGKATFQCGCDGSGGYSWDSPTSSCIQPANAIKLELIVIQVILS